MSQQALQIPRQPDVLIIQCFKKAAEKFGAKQVNANIIGYPSYGAVDIDDIEKEFDLIIKSDTAIIETLSINISGFSVSYHKGGITNLNGASKAKSPYFDDIVFTDNTSTELDRQKRLKLSSFFAKEFHAYRPERGLGETPEQVQLSAIHNATLERLEELNKKLISSTHDYRTKLDDEYSEKDKKLSQQVEDKKKNLEENYLKEHQQLEGEKASLEARRKELDDKDNTHARREIRKDILKEIKRRQEEFKLTQGTVALRKPISIAMIILVSIFIVGAVSSGVELFKNSLTGDNYAFTLIKQVLYTFGAVGSIIFYIRWMNRWFEQHSLTEFHLKQFELDMERASWLVETSLEWKDAKGTAMPPELMQSLSTNLFTDRDEIEHVVHPADQLASALLGSSSSIKLQTGDSVIEIDPKKLKKQKQTTPLR